MKVIEGDLLELAESGKFDLIAHGCNCHCTMDAGIAKGIKSTFPEAYEADAKTGEGDRDKLGSCSYARITKEGGDLIVVNAYTQYDFKGSGVNVSYDAVKSCMLWIRDNFPGRKIGLPKIGAGLAGGDWERIREIIDEVLSGEDVTLVEYKT